ncbi:DUF2920 family protein [Cohnella sp. JJ-181]|uniref:DUF2920 family protein n=1 Tax=Cohnella rhizoplanae TaxID=2974897 RepID=UPI0022FF77F8|nr:DUF2920 family protein [Cohnella sp. JJ-181]CAI6084399.1 hypothetical protein COHCIP112018_04325 [Cohnella sp. JJ-181]
MAKDYEFSMPGHPNVYGGDRSHDLNVYFSEPDTGITPDTGIVLFIAGFGGHANSNVYKKMRSSFADQYNLVTIQCDYFGWEFMQAERLTESPSNFNDMGIMQALDNITAIMAVAEIIKDNGFVFNAKKIIAYGHSHGAYLGWLINRFAPGLFSLVIDNSAWIYPVYLDRSRQLFFSDGAKVSFEYIGKQLVKDRKILTLNELYKTSTKHCPIHSFHALDDRLITFVDKRSFCNSVRNCYLHEISESKEYQKIFKPSMHGLEVDFLQLFDYVMTEMEVRFNKGAEILVSNHTIKTSLHEYNFDYSNQIPILTIHQRQT